ncbi:hypothetical protein pb186bvf_020206 [Paramecium bursaria]
MSKLQLIKDNTIVKIIESDDSQLNWKFSLQHTHHRLAQTIGQIQNDLFQ